MVKDFRSLIILFLLTAALCLLCACGISGGRTGFGPYDTTDYGARDAEIDIWEYRQEQTMIAQYGDPYDYYEEPDYDYWYNIDPPEDWYLSQEGQ